MLYREIIAVCSQIHTKHINTPCGQNVELLNVKLWCMYICVCSCMLLCLSTHTHTHTHCLQVHIPVGHRICQHCL